MEIRKGILQYFAHLPDPRIDRQKKHLLVDILAIAICAVLCGARGWNDIEEYGKANEEWFRTFLSLPNGIPSHDTFARVFAALDPVEFQKCFFNWVQALREALGVAEIGGVIALDGKTLRRSFDKAAGRCALHLVSAWSVENRLILGQLRVEDKSNEITAVPELLKLLNLQGQTVTMDAMGCQKQNAGLIVEKGGDYVLALKGNQPELYDDVKLLFESLEKDRAKELEIPVSTYETVEKEHGRIEIRRYSQVSKIEWLSSQALWKGMGSIGKVECTRIIGEKQSTETRYFISSLKDQVSRFANAARTHWEIENGLHWCLDVGMQEDQSRIRAQNAAENFSLLRRIALNLYKQDKTRKRGIEAKQRYAGWDRKYLLQVLLGTPLSTISCR